MKNAEHRIIHDRDIHPDVPFRLSWGADIEGLKTSLGNVGLISPLVLWPHQGQLRLLCGYRRRTAMREIGGLEYPCLILPEDVEPQDALILALEENLGTRIFNDAEKALALESMAKYFPAEEIVLRYLPRLGLPPRVEFLNRFLALPGLGPEALDALAAGDLDPETGQILAGMTEADRNAIMRLLTQITPNRNKRRETMTLLAELSRIEGRSIAEILSDQVLGEVIKAEKTPRPEKEKQVRRYLKTRRMPNLTRMEKKQAAHIKALNLPPSLRLTPPLNFEGLDFKLEIIFKDRGQLLQAAETARRLADDEHLAALLELG